MTAKKGITSLIFHHSTLLVLLFNILILPIPDLGPPTNLLPTNALSTPMILRVRTDYLYRR
jgi:hypothetical protein